MAGNREAYEQSMNAGHNAAWDQDWGTAIKAYGRALSEYPDDTDAHIHLGLALLRAGRLDDALKVYTRAYQLAPNDPIPLEKSADVLERMGRLREAANQYVNVAEIYLAQRDLNKAIANWRQATHLTPGLVTVHAKLAQAYERIGDKQSAIREYLVLAFNFQRGGHTERAIKAVQRALKQDPSRPDSLNALRALETGRQINPPEAQTASERDPQPPTLTLDFDTAPVEAVESSPLGPMGDAMIDALSLLAQHVMEHIDLDTAGADIFQAMELQRQGQQREAIQAYERAESVLRHPALKLNLGALLLLDNRPDQAVKHLGEAIVNSDLSAGAYHALGQSNYKMGRHKQAARFLLQSAQIIDSAGATDVESVHIISEIYDRVLELLEGRPDETLQQVNNRLINLLHGKDWRQRLYETRHQIQEALRTAGGEQSAIELLTTSNSDELTISVSLIDRYIRQNLFTLAMDEAHRAIERAPFYLPVHVRMAEIMMREGRIRQAINKYNVVARTYMVRDELDRAASILGEVLEMAPLDISVRTHLIELLEAEERWDEALDQYIDLADTYQQLGEFEMARNTYLMAERIANRVQAPVERVAGIKHRIADIDQLRSDFRRAQRIYEEIADMHPDDERARRMLVDLNYRQNNQMEAHKRLDQLLSLYARQKQINKIVSLLEEFVAVYPNDTGLRSRLAAIYRQLNRPRDAIQQLDALGELQLEAGLHEEAATTIRQIISLKPEGVEDYRRLLTQLGG